MCYSTEWNEDHSSTGDEMINKWFVIGFISYMTALIIMYVFRDTDFWIVFLIISLFVTGTINLLIAFGFWKSPAGELRSILLEQYFALGINCLYQATDLFLNRHEVYNERVLIYRSIGLVLLAHPFLRLAMWIYKKRT